MRRIMLGVLMAAGAMLPAIAVAQDMDHREDHPRQHANERGQPPANGERHEQQRPAAAPPSQAQPQQKPRPAPTGERPQDGGRFGRGGDGGQGFRQRQQDQRQQQDQQQQQAQQQQARQQAQARDQQQYRQNGYPGQRDPGYRGDRGYGDRGRFDGPPVAPGSGGYRPQGGPPIAPGSGGYRPQGGYNGRDGGSGYRPAPPAGRGGNWSRGWREDNRYDWGRYRAQNRAAFHLPHYYAPQGWRYGYRRFSPGLSLSFELFDRSYWIDDAYAYRLPPAQWPYQWVRYYNDALLVDVRSGYVVDTVYDIFY